MLLYSQICSEIQSHQNSIKAKTLQRFFKTGKGQYGQGDIFIGVDTPTIRSIAQKYYKDIRLSSIQKLLQNPIHEYRSLALIILIIKFQSFQKQIKKISSSNLQIENSSQAKLNLKNLCQKQKNIYDFYLANTHNIDNWDLVDISAPKIVGTYLLDRNTNDRKILYQLARSQNLWEKRIAIISTLTFIKAKQFQDTLNIAQILLLDSHDLIHKAVGWMLREVGKIDQIKEENFLMEHYRQMPRTCLRYAIEKFTEDKRQFYLKK